MIENEEKAILAARGEDWHARIEAERYLAAHGELPTLTRLACEDDWRVRLVAARALAQHGASPREILRILDNRLEEEQDSWVLKNLKWGVREQAARATSN